MELRPPEAAPLDPSQEVPSLEREAEPEVVLPIELEPLLYVVQRTTGSRATILPLAQYSEDEYAEVPDPEEVPDLLERFLIGRWEEGAEFALLAHGRRVGTYVSDGTTGADNSSCQIRPRGGGYIEVQPEATELTRFLALPVPDSGDREPWVSLPPVLQDDELRAASLNLAQRMIPVLDVLWPPSIPDTQRDLQPFSLAAADGSAFAVSYVYGDRLSIGPSNSRAYSLFMLAAQGETPSRYEPILTWHQEASSGKAFPRFLGAHDVRGVGTPDAVLEVFGETSRWYTILGAEGDDWTALYLDACGEPASRGAIRTFP